MVDVDFNKICRACMKTGILKSIFVKRKGFAIRISDMFYACTLLQVNEGDELPSKICRKCELQLSSFYKFQKTSLENDSKLKSFLNKLDDKISNHATISSCQSDDENGDVNLPTQEENIKPFCENWLPQEVSNEKYFENVRVPNISKDPESCGKENTEKEVCKNSNFVKEDKDTDDDSIENKRIKVDSNEEIKKEGPKNEIGKLVTEDVTSNEMSFNTLENQSESFDGEKENDPCRKNSKTKFFQTFQCEACGKLLSCRSNLVQHMRQHTGERPFGCDHCDRRFARAEHLRMHKRIHTGERPHSCTVCSKRFVQYAALTAHLRTHTGERPHMCAICGKTFSQSVSLTYHTRTHTGETPYKCAICQKGFAHSGNLNIHMRFHLNERPFSCTICDKRFVTSSHLRVHIKQHTGVKPHQCNICGKAFVRSEHLKDHLVIHTGQKPHACRLCPKRYTQSSHLKRHMKSHKNDKT